ncbi:DUF4296 domain-containing protein, partial [Bacteroidota bacterium]
YFISIIVLLFVFACKPENKKEKMDIIPKQELIPILVDMHKVDGALSVYKIRREYKYYDKKKIYDEVLSQHNTAREQFNYSLEYYSADLDEFEFIFEKVIEELSKLEDPADAQSLDEDRFSSSRTNLWNLKENWFLPQDGRQNQIPFSLPVTELGRYTVRAKIKLFSDDQSENPKLVAYFWYDNGSAEGYRDYFEAELRKTGEFENYAISKRLKDDNITHLKGWILYNDLNNDVWEKHAEVTDIRIEFGSIRRRYSTN